MFRVYRQLAMCLVGYDSKLRTKITPRVEVCPSAIAEIRRGKKKTRM